MGCTLNVCARVVRHAFDQRVYWLKFDKSSFPHERKGGGRANEPNTRATSSRSLVSKRAGVDLTLCRPMGILARICYPKNWFTKPVTKIEWWTGPWGRVSVSAEPTATTAATERVAYKRAWVCVCFSVWASLALLMNFSWLLNNKVVFYVGHSHYWPLLSRCVCCCVIGSSVCIPLSLTFHAHNVVFGDSSSSSSRANSNRAITADITYNTQVIMVFSGCRREILRVMQPIDRSHSSISHIITMLCFCPCPILLFEWLKAAQHGTHGPLMGCSWRLTEKMTGARWQFASRIHYFSLQLIFILPTLPMNWQKCSCL